MAMKRYFPDDFVDQVSQAITRKSEKKFFSKKAWQGITSSL